MTEPTKYRRKPRPVEAILFTQETLRDVIEWLEESKVSFEIASEKRLETRAEVVKIIIHGHWNDFVLNMCEFLVRDSHNGFSARPEIDFLVEYEEVTDEK